MYTIEKVLSSINEMSALRDGWYDSDGKEITRRAIQTGLDLAFQEPYPYIYPTIEGGLSLEWQLDSGCFIVSVLHDGSIQTEAMLVVYNRVQKNSKDIPITVSDAENVLDTIKIIQHKVIVGIKDISEPDAKVKVTEMILSEWARNALRIDRDALKNIK